MIPLTREERSKQIELSKKVSQIIAHLEECDGLEVNWTYSRMMELTEEVTRFEESSHDI